MLRGLVAACLVCIGVFIAIWIWTRPRALVLVEEHLLDHPIINAEYDDVLYSTGLEIAGVLYRTDGFYRWAPGYQDDRLLNPGLHYYKFPIDRSSLSPNKQHLAIAFTGSIFRISTYLKGSVKEDIRLPAGEAVFLTTLDSGDVLCCISYGKEFELLRIHGSTILSRARFPRPAWLTKKGLWTTRFSPDGRVCIIADAAHFGLYRLIYTGKLKVNSVYVAKEPFVKWPYPDQVINQPVMMGHNFFISQNGGVYDDNGLVNRPDGWCPNIVTPSGASALVQFKWNHSGKYPYMKRDLRIFYPGTGKNWALPGQSHRFCTATPDGRFALIDELPKRQNTLNRLLQTLPWIQEITPEPTLRIYLSLYECPGRLRARIPLEYNGLDWYYERKSPWKLYKITGVMISERGDAVFAVAHKTDDHGRGYDLLLRFK